MGRLLRRRRDDLIETSSHEHAPHRGGAGETPPGIDSFAFEVEAVSKTRSPSSTCAAPNGRGTW